MDDNARHCAKTCFYHLRRIRQLRHYIDYDTLHTLIQVLIMSRLDDCNSLFICSSQSIIHHFHNVCKMLRPPATLLCEASPRLHASPIRQRLHWLPASRFEMNIIQALHLDVRRPAWYHTTVPRRICVITAKTIGAVLPHRATLLYVKTRLCLSDKSFSVAELWASNALPANIKLTDSCINFRKKLKTHFFKIS